MGEVCTDQNKEKPKRGAGHAHQERSEGVEAEALNDDTVEGSIATIGDACANLVCAQKPCLWIFKRLKELIHFPLGSLEAMCVLLRATVSIGALIGFEKTSVKRRVGQKEQKHNAPDKSDNGEDDEEPAPGGNVGLDVANGVR